MKQRFVSALAALLVMVVVAGCGPNGIAKEEAGALIGAGLGGLAGSMIGDGGGQAGGRRCRNHVRRHFGLARLARVWIVRIGLRSRRPSTMRLEIRNESG